MIFHIVTLSLFVKRRKKKHALTLKRLVLSTCNVYTKQWLCPLIHLLKTLATLATCFRLYDLDALFSSIPQGQLWLGVNNSRGCESSFISLRACFARRRLFVLVLTAAVISVIARLDIFITLARAAPHPCRRQQLPLPL